MKKNVLNQKSGVSETDEELSPQLTLSSAASLSNKKRKDDPVMVEDEGKANIFEIISDLEKQLDDAFSIKDAQEDEITELNQQLSDTKRTASALSEEVKDLKAALTSQEELNSALKFLEGERLEASKRIKALEDDCLQKSDIIEKQGKRTTALMADAKARETRIEQMELELSNSCEKLRTLQSRINLLEQEKETLMAELENTNKEMRSVILERDKNKQDLDLAKRGMEEIRTTLSKTRAKARGHYYRSKSRE